MTEARDIGRKGKLRRAAHRVPCVTASRFARRTRRRMVALSLISWCHACDAAVLGAQPGGRVPLAAFAIEFAGAAMASGVGYGIISQAHPACRETADVVSCSRSARYVWMLGAATAAPVGAVMAGRLYHTEPSVAGAMVGSVTGVLLAAGIDRAARRQANRRLDRVELGVLLMLTQGALTSAGSRLFALRRRSGAVNN